MARPPNYAKLIWPFSGDTDIERYIAEFDKISSLAEWDEDYKTLLMRSKCIGRARDYIELAIPIGKDVTYSELCTLLKNEFKPLEKLAVRLKRFRECKQFPKESVTTFAARVRSLGLATCDLRSEEDSIDSRLLAQFLDGLRSRHVLEYILTKDAETFAGGIRLAREAESNAGFLQSSHTVSAVDANTDPRIPSWNRKTEENQYGRLHQTYPQKPIRRPPRPSTPNAVQRATRPSTMCTYCRKPNHEERDCRLKLRNDGRCFACKERGHMAKNCTRRRANGVMRVNTTSSYQRNGSEEWRRQRDENDTRDAREDHTENQENGNPPTEWAAWGL